MREYVVPTHYTKTKYPTIPPAASSQLDITPREALDNPTDTPCSKRPPGTVAACNLVLLVTDDEKGVKDGEVIDDAVDEDDVVEATDSVDVTGAEEAPDRDEEGEADVVGAEEEELAETSGAAMKKTSLSV